MPLSSEKIPGTTWLSRDPVIAKDVAESYATDRSAVQKLADKYKADHRTIYNTLRVLGIQTRTVSEAKKGARVGPSNHRWKGGRTKESGYIKVKKYDHHRAYAQNYIREHILIAEAALGKPLPPKAHIHHVDGNRSNNANSNLVICQNMEYHALLHIRSKILSAGGNPNTERICGGCNSVKPRTEFGGSATRCRACNLKYYHSRKKRVGSRAPA